MTAAFVLAGLRASRQTLSTILRGVKVMHESSAFELYEEKGRVEESHRLLLRQGRNRFGVADAAAESALRAIDDLDRLERMADAVLTAPSWQEFLATP
jgi:phosphoketolase